MAIPDNEIDTVISADPTGNNKSLPHCDNKIFRAAYKVNFGP